MDSSSLQGLVEFLLARRSFERMEKKREEGFPLKTLAT